MKNLSLKYITNYCINISPISNKNRSYFFIDSQLTGINTNYFFLNFDLPAIIKSDFGIKNINLIFIHEKNIAF